MSPLIDSHCHIPLIQPEIDLENILNEAKAQNIIHMLCVSVDLPGFPAIKKLAEDHEMISASVGIHPNTEMDEELTVDEIVELADHEKVVAIGETGLDYFRSEGDLEWQRDRFRRHIRAAKESKKPLIIHTRDAKEDTLKVLEEENAAEIGGVMHCFVEDWETAQRAMDMNFMISFSGIVTFKNAKDLQEVAKLTPIEKMLVETDSPYLAPTPNRGKTNQPAYVRYVAEFIAGLKETSIEEVAEHTTRNYQSLFASSDV